MQSQTQTHTQTKLHRCSWAAGTCGWSAVTIQTQCVRVCEGCGGEEEVETQTDNSEGDKRHPIVCVYYCSTYYKTVRVVGVCCCLLLQYLKRCVRGGKNGV